ncbi:MAG: glutamyl-tRNA reductase [Propionibacteriaceae bacterium]|nr:glutamyl-tRNA reductase [Propionibacteriaceae bacterium]
MPLLCVGISHREAQPSDLAALAESSKEIGNSLARHIGVHTDGQVMLATCNRFEIYLEANTFHGAVGLAMGTIRELIPHLSDELVDAFYSHSGPGAVEHLYRVATGLESMVVGESEILGQVKTALSVSGERVSPRLRRAFQGALSTAKAVATQTGLGSVGRSLASVGLDLATADLPRPDLTDGTDTTDAVDPWASARVLIVGTGQYAGTVVADLLRRGCDHLVVYSGSGNAASFADRHAVTPTHDLAASLKSTDVLVAASGNGPAKITAATLESSSVRVVVDLSGGADVTGELPVRVIDLVEIGVHAPPACQTSIDQAEQMITDGVTEFLQDELGRGAAPAVTAMRGYVGNIIDAELTRARGMYPPEVADAIEWSLHRATSALLHHPSVAAVELARIGRMEEYNQALETLFGILVEPKP